MEDYGNGLRREGAPTAGAPTPTETGNSNYHGPVPPPVPMPKFEESRIPVRKPKKFWKIGGFLILAGFVFATAGWFNGARGGAMYFDRGGFHIDTPEDISNSGVFIENMNQDPFETVEVSAGVADVNFIESDNFGMELIFPDGYKPEWSWENGRLKIDATGNFPENGIRVSIFSLYSEDAEINIYYPEDAFIESVDLSSDVGSIDAEFPDTGFAELNVGTGDITARFNGEASVEATSGVGDITLSNDGDGSISASVNSGTGSIEINDGEWYGLTAETGVGEVDIDAELLAFTNIKTGTGDVTIDSSFEGDQGYNLTADMFAGSIEVNGNNFEGGNATNNTTAGNLITVKTGVGDIELETEN